MLSVELLSEGYEGVQLTSWYLPCFPGDWRNGINLNRSWSLAATFTCLPNVATFRASDPAAAYRAGHRISLLFENNSSFRRPVAKVEDSVCTCRRLLMHRLGRMHFLWLQNNEHNTRMNESTTNNLWSDAKFRRSIVLFYFLNTSMHHGVMECCMDHSL
jgi:hypothetical protein